MPGNPINVTRDGRTYTIDEDQVPGAIDRGYAVETAANKDARAAKESNEEAYGGALGTVAAGIAAVERGFTGGLSDAYLRATGGDSTRRYIAGVKEANPTLSTVGEVAGSLIPVGAVGKVGQAARGAFAVGKDASLIAHVASAAKIGAVEGGAMGLGSGISELALSEDPLTAERAVSVLGMNTLKGAAIGGVVGGVTKLGERGLARAQEAIETHIAESSKLAAVPEDLAGLDAKGLKAAKESHLADLETARVGDRKALADDLGAFRSEVKDSKIFLATKEADAKAVEGIAEMAARNAKAEVALRNVLDNPIALAERPQMALTALQKQQSALEGIAKADPELRAAFAADATGARAASLDAVAPTLEKNLALQDRIRATMAPHASPRLDAITTAQESLQAGGGKSALQSMAEVGMQGPIMHAIGAAIPIPVVGHAVGAYVAKKATDLVFGRLSLATGEAAKKTADVIGRFVDVANKATKVAPVLATKVLAAVRYAPPLPADRKKQDDTKSSELADLYRARSAEIRSQVAPGPTGAVMRQDAREAMAQRLLPIRSRQPILADRMETIAARKVEFLANVLPRKPDIMAMQTGPDTWKPSELKMRTWARYAAAVEDPDGVEDRLAAGTITPEDAQAYNAVYPERAAHLKQQIIAQLPTLRSSLPYGRRLALSIFTGAPVDAALDPQIFGVLQAGFAADQSATGGAPMAGPQFGSVKKSADQPTPSQSRAT